MKSALLTASVIAASLLSVPAWAQDEAALAACVEQGRTETGLSEPDLSRMRPGDPFRVRGREYFIGKGEFPRDTCMRVLAIEGSIASEAQKAQAAMARAEATETSFIAYQQRQGDEVNSPEYRYRYFTAIISVATFGGILLYLLALLLRRKKKRRSFGRSAFDVRP